MWSLLDGKAYTATELSIIADTTRQPISNHLSRLLEANLVVVEKQGRHRYFRLANEKVAQVIESMAGLIPDQKMAFRKSAEAQKLGYAGTCYDHLAGKLSIDLLNTLVEKEIFIAQGNLFDVTDPGKSWLKGLGIDIATLQNKKRSFAHPCMDWTERRHHLAGALGAALLETFLQKDWIRRKQATRELLITTLGETKLFGELGLPYHNN